MSPEAQYLFAASIWAVRRAEAWRKQVPYLGAGDEARAEMRHHVACRAEARTLAKQAKEAKP